MPGSEEAMEITKIQVNGTEYDISDSKSKSEIIYGNAYSFIVNENPATTGTDGNVTFTWLNKKKVSITTNGTSSGGPTYEIYHDTTHIPANFKAGETYHVRFKRIGGTTKYATLKVYFYNNGSLQSSATFDKNGELTVPANTTGLIIRISVTSGITATETLEVDIVTSISNAELTLDAASVLHPNGTENRKDEIEEILTKYGVCRLAPGEYYISFINMPDGSTLIGSGMSSVIKPFSDTGNLITAGEDCCISDLLLDGGLREAPSEAVDLKAIYIPEGTPGVKILNCNIIGFGNIGVYCLNTGFTDGHSVLMDNCKLQYNYIGIYLAYRSEYGVFSNLIIIENRYGVRNYGGNNKFTNCGFDKNRIAFEIDGTGLSQNNNGHGSCVSCSFNHNVYGLRIISMTNGFTFDGCALFDNSTFDVYFSSVANIIVNGCNFAAEAKIQITGSSFVLFTNCLFNGAISTLTSSPTNFPPLMVNCHLINGMPVFFKNAETYQAELAIRGNSNLTRTDEGITFTFDNNGVCTVSSSTPSTGAAVVNLYADYTALPGTISAGDYMFVDYETTDINCRAVVYFYDSNKTNIGTFADDKSMLIKVPTEAVGCIVRMSVGSGRMANGTARLMVFNGASNQRLTRLVFDNIESIESIEKRVGGYTNTPMLTLIDDDGNSKFYTDLYPMALEKGVSIATAMPYGSIGTANHMDLEQIRTIHQNGVEVLSHTYRHDYEDTDTEEVFEMDYRKAKYCFSEIGIVCNVLIYAGSSGNLSAARTAAKRVYDGAIISGDQHINHVGGDKYQIERYGITDGSGTGRVNGNDLDELKDLIDTLVSSGGWMVWMLHTSGEYWGDTMKDNIASVIDYAKSNGVSIVTAEYGFKAYYGS